ncbi:MAG: hypothetical protein ACYDAQ_19085 [Mycobacteriales bacterium]
MTGRGALALRRRRRCFLLAAGVGVLAAGLLVAPAAAAASSAAGPTGGPAARAARGAATVLPAPATSTMASPATSPATSTEGSTGASTVPSPPPGGVGVGPPLPTPPAPAATGPAVSGGGASSPGFFDITGHITAAIDSWFRGLVTSALNPILTLLGHTLLATPALTGQPRIAALWGLTAGVADTTLVLLVLAGGAIVMSHETLQTRTAAKDLAPRIVVAAIAANASLALCGQGINLADALSGAVLGGGVPAPAAASVLTEVVLRSLTNGGIFLVLLGGVVAVLAIVLLATYLIRLALVVLLVIAAPLALITHALPQTEAVARLWWRGIIGCFAVQLGQSLVLVTALRVFLATGGGASLGLTSSGGLVDLLVAACLCWVLVRIPAWVARSVFGGGHHGGRGGVGRTVRDVVVYKTIGAIKAGLAAAG